MEIQIQMKLFIQMMQENAKIEADGNVKVMRKDKKNDGADV